MAAPRAGAIDQLAVVDVPEAEVGAGEVVVRVVASTVNPADYKVLGGEFAGRVLHARTKPLLAGYDFSGVVERCGDGVTDVAPGREVFGHLAYSSSNRQGAFAERVVVARDTVAVKPAAVSHADAAASATQGLTALQALRDHGRLPQGGHALVIGAAGGVGSLAIGVARGLGARVTGVCSTYAVDFVRELGADDIVDRRTQDVRALAGPYDVVFDAAAAYSYAAMRHALTPSGAYVTTLPSPAFVGGKLMALFSRRRCRFISVKSVRADLEQLAIWMTGDVKLRVPVEAHFPVRELGAAIARMRKGEGKGRIVVDVEGGW